MGADAKLFLFDYELYRESVVPAFNRLMCEGSMDQWLLGLLETHEDEPGFRERVAASKGFVPSRFWDCCAYFDSEFGLTKTFAGPEGDYNGSWEARACRDSDCPLRDTCPFHEIQGEQLNPVVDDWMRWLEKAIVHRCLGPGQFLGRSIDCFFYWDILDEQGIPLTHPIRVLLERLGRRGFAIGYGGSLGTEGIHGWLSPAESKALADHLFSMDLPDYEYSFTTMERFKQVRNLLEGRVPKREFRWPAYNHPNASFQELSLSYVRTVCTLAGREGKGVLWGNDVA
jgi:hypothetical protein